MPSRRRATPLAPDDRRAAIVDAVVPLLIERGAAVTTKEIAAAAGVAEGTLFSVFDDKRSLILAAIDRRLDPAPMVADLASIDPETSLDARLLAAADLIVPRVEEVRALTVALHGLPVATPRKRGEGRQMADAWHLALGEAMTALLTRHAAELRGSPSRLAELFLALLLASRPPIGRPREPLSAREIVDHFLHGAVRELADGAC